MTNEPLHVSVELINDKVQFTGVARDNPAITLDYIPPIGDGQGYMALELLLISLAVCSATSVVAMLRKMRKTVTGCRMQTRGTRREEHPTGFTRIVMELEIDSPDATDAELQKAIRLSEETYCPVWAMLKGAVEICAEGRIVAEASAAMLTQ